jgi:hypothetical protein
MSRLQGSASFSVRCSRPASRGVPPLTIGGPSSPPTSAIRHRRLVKDRTSRGARRSQWRTSRQIATTRRLAGNIAPHRDVPGTECAGTTSPRRGTSRTFRYRVLHGKRASAWFSCLGRRPPLVRTARSKPSNQPLERPRCSGDAGTPGAAQKAGVQKRKTGERESAGMV